MIYDCIIIGGGASGLMCGSSMKHPVKGLILEKTRRAGTKLLMSGSGQCNITHSGSIKDFVGCYGKNGAKIRSCLYQYSNLSLVDFLKTNGIQTVTRQDGKIFPASMDAHDVLDMLLCKSAENGFELRYGSAVSSIKAIEDGWQVIAGGKTYAGKNLIVASGGCSYPSTGSDGSFFHVLKRDLGIEVTELKPALSSIQVEDYPYGELSGISFDSARITIWHSGRKAADTCDALLFTHKDLSGPAVLNISKYASAGDAMTINYVYPLAYEDVLERLKSAVHGRKGIMADIIAGELGLPKRFCRCIAERYGDSLKTAARILTEERLAIASVSGFDRAMATCGGIALNQINTSTMEFQDHPGLYAIGEALDVDGITGGYNLQFAYSSARAAAEAAGERLASCR